MSNHHKLEPTVIIGKDGITENIIKKIIEQIKRKKIVKVKFLPSAIKDNKRELITQIVQATNTKIEHKVGFVVVLSKKISSK